MRPTDTRLIMLTAALLLSACKGGDTDDSTPDDSGETAVDTSPPGPEDFPDSPAPFTLTVAGAWPITLTFDAATCSHPVGSSNLRVFWRGDGHSAVIKLDLLGTYTGTGEYNETDHRAAVTLQEEAGGSLEYYASGEGDQVGATLEYGDDDLAWGEFTVSGLSGDNGSVTVTPLPIPIWCPAFT